jgi:tetratricopeptide (TPR) repeat protein
MAWMLVPIAALLTHASYISNGFAWLDHIDIEQREAIVPLSEWATAFLTRFGETGFYRPMVTLAHSLDLALYGDWAPGFHLTNVLLHAAVAAAAVPFVRCLLPLGRLEAAVAGLVLAVHPLSSLPAGAISYRPELLVSLFTLLAVSFYAHARQTRRWTSAAGAVGATFLALLAKETAVVTIPALVLLWELTAQTATPWKKSSGLLIGGGMAIAVWVALRLHAVPDVWRATSTPLSLSQALGTRLAVIGQRLLELVTPLKPDLSDAARIVELGSPSALLPIVVGVGAVGFVLRRGLRSPWSIALGFVGVALAPALNVVPLPRFSSPHYGYFASLGTGMIALLGLRAVASWPKLHRTAAAALTVWLAVAAISTFTAGPSYHDDLTLFGPEVARDPLFLEGRSYLGDRLAREEQYEGAAAHYEIALQGSEGVIAFVDGRSVAVNLAGIRLRQERFQEAEALLSAAARDAPPRLRPHIAYNRALVASKTADHARVVALLDEAGADWGRPEPLLLRAQALRRLGRTNEAIETLRRVMPLVDEQRRHALERVVRMLSERAP